MLYILTGAIQIGKTRWLCALADALQSEAVPVAGVVAPGVWVPSDGPHANKDGFEKLGIDNVLLPAGQRVHLARRRDLVLGSAACGAACQSERAALGWLMDDRVLARVNEHFAWLAASDAHGRQDSGAAVPGCLVVDELGRLELVRGEGLTHAVELLARGPRPGWSHAVAVVRKDLLPAAHALLDDAWAGQVREIAPSPEMLHRLAHDLAADRRSDVPTCGDAV